MERQLKEGKGGEKVNLREIPFKKPVKLLVLLLSSMLIATASAAVYYSLTMQSTATVAAAPVYFTEGADSSGIWTPGTNYTYVSLNLNAYPNVTLTYEQAVNLTATIAKEVQLRHVSISPDDGNPSVSNFTSVVFTLKNATGSVKGTLTYTVTAATDTWNEPTTPTGYVAIGAGQEWTIKVEIKAAAGAKAGVSTTIVIAVDVR
jgi:hypothetical protein